MKTLARLLLTFLLVSNANAEILYMCSTGDGSDVTAGVCATAWDEGDFSTVANWASGANKLSCGDTIRFMDDGGDFTGFIRPKSETCTLGNEIIFEPNGTDNITITHSSSHVILFSGSQAGAYHIWRKGTGTFNVKMTGTRGSPSGAFWIDGTAGASPPDWENIVVDGLIFDGTRLTNQMGIVFAALSTNITIKNVTVTDFDTGIAFRGSGGANAQISDSTIQDTTVSTCLKDGIGNVSGEHSQQYDDIILDNVTAHTNDRQGFSAVNFNRLVVKNSLFHTNGASGINMEKNMTKTLVRDNVMRDNNTGSSKNEAGFWGDESQDMLVERNIFHGNTIGLTFGDCERCIARFNISHNNNNTDAGTDMFNACLRSSNGQQSDPNDHHMFAHNVCRDDGITDPPSTSNNSPGGAVIMGGDTNIPIDFTNNAFYDVRSKQEVQTPAGQTKPKFRFNHHFNPDRALNFWWDGAAVNAATWDGTTQSSTEIANGSTDPLFTDPSTNDYTLQSTSPLINAGGDLTTVSSTSGSDIVVGESGWFTDGYGIAGESGDLIAIFDDADWTLRGTATVTSINHSTHTLTVDAVPSGTAAGDFVVYAKDFNGDTLVDRPEIGAYWFVGGCCPAPMNLYRQLRSQ